VLVSPAIVLLAFAVLFLAVVILFREEIRKVIGFILAGFGLLFLWSLVRESWVIWLPGVVFISVLLAYAGQTMRKRQQATAPKPGQTPEQLALTRLKDLWEHGELDDAAYHQGLRDILGAEPDSVPR
jgi:membrane protein implicated in regulation of membrane protease activity